MKHNAFIITLILLTAAFLWGCEQETLSPEAKTIEFRGHKANHGGGNNGGGNNDGGEGSEPEYGVVYDGTIIITEESVGTSTNNSKKFAEMGMEGCGSNVDIEILGINDLKALVGLDTCYAASYCSHYAHLRQLDKKNNPRRVAGHFNTLTGPHLTMFGDIQETTDGVYTIFPTEVGTPVTIVFDKWGLFDGSPQSIPAECLQDYTDFAPGDEQHLTIRLLTSAEADAICAALVASPACN